MRWWRVFKDRLTGGSDDGASVGGPRRRQAPRYHYAARLFVKCESWPRFNELYLHDISEGGMFIQAAQPVQLGEQVEVCLQLPDGSDFVIGGQIVNSVGVGDADQRGGIPGMGVQFHDFNNDSKIRLEEILIAARAAQPIPEPVATKPSQDWKAPDHTSPLERNGWASLSALDNLLERSVPDDADAIPHKQDVTVEEFVADELDDEFDVDFDSDFSVEEPPPAAVKRRPPTSSGRESANIPAIRRHRTTDPDAPIVGIDLGTTYTSVSTVQDNRVLVVARSDGTRSTPSVVSFPSRDSVIVGYEARRRVATDPSHTVVSPKRLLGRNYDDQEVQSFIGRAPYRTFAGPDHKCTVEFWGNQYAIPQLCSYMLKDIREVAEDQLGYDVNRAVFTVPIAFDEGRVESLRRAAQLAQIEIVAVIDEPSAAALANRFDRNFGGIVGVYDFGGGTFDFSIVDVSQGDFRVLATAGDTWLGGDDFDQVLAEAAANQFWRKHKVDLRTQAVEWQRLLFACERAKRELTSAQTTLISVPKVLRAASGMVDLNLSVSREILKRAATAIIQRSLGTCNQALSLCNLKPDQLSAIYLSGGTTYIPAVRDAVAAHFKVPVRTGVPPEHSVCLGAAIHAAQVQFRGASTLAAR